MRAETIVGATATVLAIAFSWPQVVRGWRTDSTEGIEPRSFLWGACGSTLWTIYGAAIGDVPLVVSNVSIVVGSLLVVALCVRHGRIAVAPVAVCVGASLAAGLAGLARSEGTVGLLAVILGAPAIVPQTVRVWRTRRLHGVSAVMYATVAACCCAWLAYGVLIRDWYVAMPNSVGITCASYIAWRAHDSHRRFATPAADESSPGRSAGGVR